MGLDPRARREIEDAVADHTILDHVIKSGVAADPPRLICNVVAQDEYTHDVVVRYSDALFLVYDCT